MVIVGMMPVYEEADWVKYAVEGIIDFVDELVIAEGYQGPAWHFGSCRSKDGTIDILEKLARKYDKITLTQCQPRGHVLRGKAATHNHVLKVSKRIKDADWYMICDADEFYTEKQKESLLRDLVNTEFDLNLVNAMMFFYNFKFFISQSLGRFIRVIDGMFFKPGQFPYYANGKPYNDNSSKDSTKLLSNAPMYHYSFVKRPSQEIKRRIMEYCATQRERYVFDWIEQVFLRWSPENSEEIYSLNKKLFNGDGIFFDGAGDNQKLKEYKGEHPENLDSHPFRNLDDVRKVEELPRRPIEYVQAKHHIAYKAVRFVQSIKGMLRS